MSNTFIFETTIFIDTIHPYPNPISHYNTTKIMLQKQHNFIPMSTNQAKLKNVMKRNSKLHAYGWPINATTERVLRSYRSNFTWNHTYTTPMTYRAHVRVHSIVEPRQQKVQHQTCTPPWATQCRPQACQ